MPINRGHRRVCSTPLLPDHCRRDSDIHLVTLEIAARYMNPDDLHRRGSTRWSNQRGARVAPRRMTIVYEKPPNFLQYTAITIHRYGEGTILAVASGKHRRSILGHVDRERYRPIFRGQWLLHTQNGPISEGRRERPAGIVSRPCHVALDYGMRQVIVTVKSQQNMQRARLQKQAGPAVEDTMCSS